ncbi:MAG: hypothetical protein V5A66_04995 [Candidatus Thermoplasmatota archaeon]
MKKHKFLKPEYSSKVIGAIFILISIYLFLRTDHRNAGLAAAFIGIFTLLIVHYPTVEEDVAVAELKSAVLSYDGLLQDLEVSENGVILPPGDNLTKARVYVPAGKFEGVPDIYDEMAIVSSDRGRTGVALVPPGQPLLEEAKNRIKYEIEGEGIQSGRECMGHLSKGMGLAKSFSFREKEDKIRIRITLDRYDDYCENLRESSPNICTRTGCPICSAYLTSASEALSSPLKIENFEKENNHIKYRLEEV